MRGSTRPSTGNTAAPGRVLQPAAGRRQVLRDGLTEPPLRNAETALCEPAWR